MVKKHRPGFTIVELLIVIVVIAIIAAITVVAYNGISKRAVAASMQTDLAQASKQLKLFYVDNGVYPTANNCSTPSVIEICLRSSSGTNFNYSANNAANPPTFSLIATNGSQSYTASSSSSPGPYTGNQVTLTNMLANSNFGNGGSSWTNHCNAPSTCDFSGGKATLTADSSARAVFYQPAYGTYNDGDKIYYSARISRLSGSGMRSRAFRTTGGYDYAIMATSSFDGAPTNNYVRYSGIRTFVESQGAYTSSGFGDYTTGKIFQSLIDDTLAINLTSSFGAGNEPTVSGMDGILSQYQNGWFDGTVTATY